MEGDIEAGNRFITEVFDPERDAAGDVLPALVALHHSALGEIGSAPAIFGTMLAIPRNVFVFLRDRGRVAGASIASPRTDTEAHIMLTALYPRYQRQGHVGKLMSSLEAELVRRGFTTVTQNARVLNGYADTIAAHYGDRVIDTAEADPLDYGPRRFFRIRL